MSLQFFLGQKFFLAVLTLKDFLHMDEHVLLERLSVDEHLAAVVTEHAGVQQVVVLHLKMFLHLRQLLKVLTAPVTPEGSHLGAGVR